MPTRKRASGVVYDAIVKLLLAYDTASPEGKRAISRSLTGLYTEYAELERRPNLLGEPYSVLTEQMQSSARALKAVAEDADEYANFLVTAAQILASVTAVLRLF